MHADDCHIRTYGRLASTGSSDGGDCHNPEGRASNGAVALPNPKARSQRDRKKARMLWPISLNNPRFGCVTRRAVERASVVGRESGQGVADEERGGCQAGAASGAAYTAGISAGGAGSGTDAEADGGRGSARSGAAGRAGGTP